MITAVVMPFILSTAINNLNDTVNTNIYTKWLPDIRSINSVEIGLRWGVYTGQVLTIWNIPIAFATAMAAAMLPSVAQLIAARNEEGARNSIALAVKTTMIISIPCAVGLFVLARPVTGLLFSSNSREDEDLATALLMAMAFSVVFYAMSTLNSQILQGLGKLNVPIINAGISLVVQSVVAVVLLFFTKLDLYSFVISYTVYSSLMCVLNQAAVRRAIEYRQEIVKTFVTPGVAAGLMGAAAWAIYEGLLLLTNSPKISVVIAILTGACVYFAMLLLLRGVTEQEFRSLPKGYLLVRIAKKLRLMR